MLVDLADLRGPQLFDVRRFGDDRGYFSETYNQAGLASKGLEVAFVQDNESLSVSVGTIRGLHYQKNPYAQGKLVRVVVGAVLDVIVDIREASPTFAHHATVQIDSESGHQIWIPPGFAHGFCSLLPNTVMTYKVTDFYNPDADRSIRWDDDDIAIKWPDAADPESLSPKDSAATTLAELRFRGDLFP